MQESMELIASTDINSDKYSNDTFLEMQESLPLNSSQQQSILVQLLILNIISLQLNTSLQPSNLVHILILRFKHKFLSTKSNQPSQKI